MSVPNLSGWCAWFRDHRLFYSLGGKEFRTNGYYTLANECYNKEELIGGSIDQVPSAKNPLNLNGRGQQA
jgi:hypothetical protein